ncbi:MAG: hypothetical protein JWN13_3819 [Betaproteobacteria bacterium]|nr:hypothetical protein [Betaproteobacteria bacterium]
MDRVWLFRCVTQHSSANVVAQGWQWRVEAPDGAVSASSTSFGTLPECVADAKRHGFMGDVDPSTGTFTTTRYEMRVGDYGDIVLRPRTQPRD